jgi:heterodisulfide reductase subunit B
MKTFTFLAVSFAWLYCLYACKPQQTTMTSTSTTSALLVSYQKDIYPMMVARCTPCHFPEQGRKKMLNTYDAARENINDILSYVTLPQDDEKFMPYKMKKEPLSDSMVNVLIEWKKQGFPK